jgi:hypothetical protein
MHEHHDAKLGRLAPERIVLGQREVFAVDMPADGRCAQAKSLHAVLELLRREIRKLERARSHPHEPIRVLPDEFGETFVLRPHDPPGEIAILDLVPPEAVDAQRLNVNPLLVDQRDPVRAKRTSPALFGVLGVQDDRCHFWHRGVRVDVHDAHATTADHHLPACRSSLERRDRTLRSPRDSHTSGCARDCLEEVSSVGHVSLLTLSSIGSGL